MKEDPYTPLDNARLMSAGSVSKELRQVTEAYITRQLSTPTF